MRDRKHTTVHRSSRHGERSRSIQRGSLNLVATLVMTASRIGVMLIRRRPTLRSRVPTCLRRSARSGCPGIAGPSAPDQLGTDRFEKASAASFHVPPTFTKVSVTENGLSAT